MVLISQADHAQHAKVRAEEQRVSERSEMNTWVSTWTSQQLVETAKTLTKPRPHTAHVMLVRCSRSEQTHSQAATPEAAQLEKRSERSPEHAQRAWGIAIMRQYESQFAVYVVRERLLSSQRHVTEDNAESSVLADIMKLLEGLRRGAGGVGQAQGRSP